MSDLTWNNMMFDLAAKMDEIQRPWAAFIGLIEFRTSDYAPRGTGYALNGASAGFPDLGQSVVIHTEDVELFRNTVKARTGRDVSNAELAAFLYWSAHQTRRARG
jgi:hypothetical protein